ncbi:MAG: hypothetical protein HKN59_06685 [Gammaproteobacteria bacterium]|nr:hypothetical protein [Gammaproteobacteria bacterium]
MKFIYKKQAGISMIELMIAMLIGLVLMLAMVSLFTQNRASFKQNERIARMQEDARFALNEMARDLAMTSFFGEIIDTGLAAQDTSLALATDCGPAGTPGWIYEMSSYLAQVDNATGVTASTQFSCVSGAEVVVGSDLVGIKRTAGSTTLPLTNNTVYLKSNGIVGLLLKHPEDSPPAAPVPAPFDHWEYTPTIYYVRNFFQVAGDQIPTLCRKLLDTSGAIPTVRDDCLAPGIEDMQIEFGLDTDANGSADQYVNSPTAAQLSQVMSVKVYLLARSIEADQHYINDKTFQISNKPAFKPNDNFYRRVYSTTVMLRNIKNFRNLGV